MADTHFSHDFSANYPKVKAAGINTMFEVMNHMFWGKWMKQYTTPDKAAVRPSGTLKPSAVVNSPFVMHRELEKMAGDSIKVPMFRQLKNISKKGDEQLFNRTEERKINHARVWINTMRHGEKIRKGHLSTQIMKDYGIPKTARAALTMQLARQMNFLEIPYAFYKAYNFSVLTDTTTFSGDSAVATHSHPHFYTAGAGKVSYSGGYPGNSGYETAVDTAIGAIGATHVLSGGLLRDLNAEDQIMRIPYLMTKDGTPFRMLVVEPYGMRQLREDADIKAMNRAGFVDGMIMRNPELTGMELFYEGWAIFNGGHAVYPIKSNSGTPLYGPTATADTFTNLDDFNSYASYSTFGAMIIGDNAIAQATGWDLKWTGEMWDHQMVEELGYNIGLGFARNDFWNQDDGSTGQYVKNDTSAILGYYAAAPTFS